MIELPVKLQEELKEYIAKHKIPESEQPKLIHLVRTIYKKALYDTEEAVGVVAAQSLSEPATQMSLDGKEKVIIKHNDRIGIVGIGGFVDRMLESFGKTAVDDWEIAELSGQAVFVPSITADEKIKWSRVLAASRHAAPANGLIRIKTASGREIVATDSHSFVTRKDNRLISVAGKELSNGDRIPSIRYLPENCISSIETRELGGETKYLKKTLPERLELDENLGWLFGIYLSEGNCTPNYVSISSTDKNVIAQLVQFADKFGFSVNEYDNFRGFAPGHDVRINSKHLSTLLEQACGSGSGNKRVPDFAYSANERFVAGLLRGYFDGDGNVSVDRRAIRISSNSKELIDGTALLLARFGVFSHKGEGKQYTLSIPAKYAKVFRARIGFTVESKKQSLEMLCGFENSQDFTDMIGGFGNLFRDVAVKLGHPTRYVNSCSKRQKIGRSALVRYITLFERLSKEKGVGIGQELGLMRQMAYSDIVWDEIAEISAVAPTTGYVYDLTVEGTQTFTTFDGIVTHNTMRTYHFAGTAGIQVTLGLPRLLEIFDAKQEPLTPTMTVYVKKEFHTLDKIKKIAENIKEVRVKDIVETTIVDLTELWVSCKLDMPKVKLLEIDLKKFAKTIKIRNATVEVEGSHLVLKTKKKDMKGIHKMKYSLLETHVKGIKDVTQAVVIKENEEWVINTLGSNLKKVFEVEGVDPLRTTSNNIFEVCDVLGIEAARNSIVQQAQYTMEEQGLGVDIKYIMLLADLMTMSGKIRAIGRYGISGQKASVLVRASFEETKKHLVGAAVTGESDMLAGTIENIMVNQVVPIGTGVFVLTGDIPEFATVEEGEEKKKAKKKE